ncbi:MAG TPA: ATP-dependent Clp protease proteolytic subunit, partial [Archangium sp.]
SSAIAAIYVAKTGKKPADVIAQMDKDEIMTAAEALEFGLTDSVATFDEDNAPADPAPDNKAAAGLIAAAWARVHVHAFRAQQSKRRDSKTK